MTANAYSRNHCTPSTVLATDTAHERPVPLRAKVRRVRGMLWRRGASGALDVVVSGRKNRENRPSPHVFFRGNKSPLAWCLPRSAVNEHTQVQAIHRRAWMDWISKDHQRRVCYCSQELSGRRFGPRSRSNSQFQRLSVTGGNDYPSGTVNRADGCGYLSKPSSPA